MLSLGVAWSPSPGRRASSGGGVAGLVFASVERSKFAIQWKNFTHETLHPVPSPGKGGGLS
jgi:hypothetical protein